MPRPLRARSLSRHLARHVSPFAIVLCALAMALASRPLAAQIHGDGRVYREPAKWWISGGMTTVSSGVVRDGQANANWRFDRGWQWIYAGSLERRVRPGTTIGVIGHYGTASARFRFNDGEVVDPVPGSPTSACFTSVGCGASVETWSARALMRGGDGTASDGIYQVLELEAGVQGYRNITLENGGDSLFATQTIDPIIGGGIGLGYAFTHALHVSVVQSFSYAWHRNGEPPEGEGRGYSMQHTRITLRLGF